MRTPKQKELLTLFNDLLDTILTDKTLKSKIQKGKTLMSLGEDDEMNKALMPSNEDHEMNKIVMSSNEDDNDNMNQNNNNIIKQLNDYLHKIIDISKSFKDQIKLIRKVENLNEYYFINNHGDKIF